MRFLNILAFIVFIGFQSCGNTNIQDPNKILKELSKSNDFNTAGFNFTFDLPKDWYRIDTIVQGVYFSVLINDDSIYRPRINITNESMHGKSHMNYILGTKEFLTRNMTSIVLLNDGSLNIGDKNCFWYTYNRTQNDLTREMIYYSIAVDNISYNITAGTNVGGRVKYQKTIDKIVKSFVLK